MDHVVEAIGRRPLDLFRSWRAILVGLCTCCHYRRVYRGFIVAALGCTRFGMNWIRYGAYLMPDDKYTQCVGGC
jgi:hypothetical protein